ncbi:MAG: WG repeat-containing protein [Rhodothermales bacterium]|nr:WG repeat-containing protein [Rhodothermales bacterium]
MHVYPFSRDGGVSLMDQHGTVLTDAVFDAAGRAVDGFIPLRAGSRWGLWSSRDSTWSIAAEYDGLDLVSDTVVSVRTREGFMLLSRSGRPLGAGPFHDLRDPSEGVFPAAVIQDQGPVDERVRWGVFTISGDTLVPPAFENILAFSDGLAAVRVDRRLLRFIKRSPRWGYISPGGEWRIPPEFDSARSFSDGLALVSSGGRQVFIDETGSPRITVGQGLAYGFSEGRARIVRNGLWGWMDTDGHAVIEPAWEGALDFSEGLAAVRRGGTWGYVDAQGRIVIPMRFDAAAPFRGPLAEVALDGRRFFIDRTGREVLPRSAGR